MNEVARKVIQLIEVTGRFQQDLLALCDDGTIWLGSWNPREHIMRWELMRDKVPEF